MCQYVSITDNALILAVDTDLIGRMPFKHGLYWSHDMVTRRTNWLLEQFLNDLLLYM